MIFFQKKWYKKKLNNILGILLRYGRNIRDNKILIIVYRYQNTNDNKQMKTLCE